MIFYRLTIRGLGGTQALTPRQEEIDEHNRLEDEKRRESVTAAKAARDAERRQVEEQCGVKIDEDDTVIIGHREDDWGV